MFPSLGVAIYALGRVAVAPERRHIVSEIRGRPSSRIRFQARSRVSRNSL